MKVLLIGATGNIGLRLIPALLTHKHTVVTFVRSTSKLSSLLPAALYDQISSVVQGDAKDSVAIKNAILDNGCDAVVNAAGLAAMAPWGSSDLPEIFRVVLDAVREAGQERGKPLRVWFMGGMSVLEFPGTDTMLMSYLPVFTEHAINFNLLKSLPPNTVNWSILCPAGMTPESTELKVPTESSHAKLVANATTPPLWNESWVKNIPLIGMAIWAVMNFSRYETTLEQNAELIAGDLENPESPFIGVRVGIIDGSK